MGIIRCALIEISALPQLHGSGLLPSGEVGEGVGVGGLKWREGLDGVFKRYCQRHQ